MIALLANAEGDDVSAGFERFALRLRYALIFAYALRQFSHAQHGMLLLVDDLVSTLIDTVVAAVN